MPLSGSCLACSLVLAASRLAGELALTRSRRLVRGRIERDFAGRITPAELARSAHISPNHLPRLRHAATLLRQSALTVGEIAGASGFADSNYFSRKFREIYGKNPRAYRGDADRTGGSRSMRSKPTAMTDLPSGAGYNPLTAGRISASDSGRSRS